jgi:hypothetical protein
MQINKSDRNDAIGRIARIMQTGAVSESSGQARAF